MTPTPSRGAHARSAVPTPLLALVVLLVTTLALAGTLADAFLAAAPATAGTAAAGTATAGTAVADDGAVTIEVTTLEPAVLEPGGTLTVTARVTNGTDGTLASPTVALHVDNRALSTRSALEGWAAAGLDGRTGSRISSQDPGALAPGASVDVAFSATSAELGLTGRTAWGPRGVLVMVSDGGARQAVQRTFVLWAPSGEVTPLNLSIVAAVTGPAVDPDPIAYEDALSAAVGTDEQPGRLGRLLDATSGASAVGWVADPALLAAAQEAADPAANAWADDLLQAAEGRSTFALRAYDPDIAAYAHAGAALPEGTPLPGADPEAADQTSSSPTSAWRTDLAWPAEAVPDLVTTTLAASSGATSMIVGPGALVPDESLTYTPSGVTTVSTTAGDVTTLVADAVLTELVASSEGSGVAATQRLLAETAVIARERPAEQRHVVVALSRTWDPDPGLFTARLAALGSASWVSLAPVDQLLATAPASVDRAALPDAAPGVDEIPAAQIRSLERSRADLAAFATVAADPAAIARPLEPGFVTPTAVSYRGQEAARAAAVEHAEYASAVVRGSLSVQSRSPFLFVAEQQNLPVRVSSTLAQEATVQVVLRPDDPRLRAPERMTVTIPAAARDDDGKIVPAEATVDVPVEGFGSGNVTVEVELVSDAQPQVRVADPQEFVVRVRADWESVGTVVIAVLLGIGLVAGIWRTVRRGRSPRRVAGATLEQPTVAPAGPVVAGGPADDGPADDGPAVGTLEPGSVPEDPPTTGRSPTQAPEAPPRRDEEHAE